MKCLLFLEEAIDLTNKILMAALDVEINQHVGKDWMDEEVLEEQRQLFGNLGGMYDGEPDPLM